MNKTICKFWCESCKQSRIPLVLTREQFANETFEHYLDTVVGPNVKELHEQLSPECLADQVDVHVQVVPQESANAEVSDE